MTGEAKHEVEDDIDESSDDRLPSGVGAIAQLAAGVLVVAVLIMLFIALAVAWRWALG